jgi:protein-S-isoprenylcysteine O-methyltransferase Ste14
MAETPPIPPHAAAGWPILHGWKRIVRRVRVPLGFLTAILFLIFARPSWGSLATSLILVVPGLWLRGYAAGYVQKNAKLTHTGPYAHTRNPLYLGSMLIAFGVALAAAKLWLAILLVTLFVFIYIPVILTEEEFLRETFPGYDAYAAEVPRLVPRITAARFGEPGAPPGRFSRQRYLHHREYNSLMGACAIYVGLIARMLFHRSGGV